MCGFDYDIKRGSRAFCTCCEQIQLNILASQSSWPQNKRWGKMPILKLIPPSPRFVYRLQEKAIPEEEAGDEDCTTSFLKKRPNGGGTTSEEEDCIGGGSNSQGIRKTVKMCPGPVELKRRNRHTPGTEASSEAEDEGAAGGGGEEQLVVDGSSDGSGYDGRKDENVSIYRGIYLPTLSNRFKEKKLETAYQRYACRQVWFFGLRVFGAKFENSNKIQLGFEHRDKNPWWLSTSSTWSSRLWHWRWRCFGTTKAKRRVRTRWRRMSTLTLQTLMTTVGWTNEAVWKLNRFRQIAPPPPLC